MTIVGKILVFVNLVFSLVVGGLVMVAFMARVNWEDYAKKREAQLSAVQADRDQVLKKADEDKAESDKEMAKVKAALTAAEKERDTAKGLLVKKDEELALMKQKERKDNADVQSFQIVIEGRRLQVGELIRSEKKLREEKQQLINEKNDERKLRIQADVDAKTHKARSLALEEQLRDMARELLRSRGGAAGTVVSRKRGEENPPRENVEGRVVTVDTEDNLVKLSIGGDAGLEPGHTLKVFRLHPIPEQSKYLGVIEILTVRPHEAVGRPVKPMPAMRPGDRVASRLVVGN